MKIQTKNFRIFLDKEIDIPSTGLVKFEAPSGSGKSTLISCIIFALFGSIKKPYSFGRTTCKVELYLDSLYILRSKSPNITRVKINDSEFENDDAQIEINKYIGLNYNQFYLSSYISQNSPTSIVSLEPDKLAQFIQDLIISDDKFKNLKTKIKEILVQQKEFLTRDRIKFDTLSPQLEEKKEIVEMDEKEILKLEKQLREIKKQKDELIKEKQKLKPIIEKYNISQNKEKSVNMEIEYLETSLKNKVYREDINDILTKKREQIEYMQIKKQYENMIENVKLDTTTTSTTDVSVLQLQLESIKKQIHDELESERTQEKISSILDGTSIEFKTSITEISDGIILLKQSVSDIKNVYNCPNCLVSLVLKKDKLTTIRKDDWLEFLEKNKDFSFDRETQKQLKEKEKEVEEKINFLKKQELIREQQSFVKKQMEEELSKFSVIVDIKENIDDLEKEAAIKQTVQEIVYNLNLKKEYLKKIKKEGENLDFSTIKETNLDSFDKKIEIKSSKINILTSKISKLKIDYNTFLFDKNKNDKIDSIQKKLDILKLDIDSWTTEILDLEHLKELYRKAEIIAFQKRVDEINEIANEFLTKFFSEAVSVKIVPFKETKKEKKTKLSIEIEYKGSKYDTLDQLSGGELQRVNLAFMLATNEVLNSKFLFLDECLNNLHSDLNKEIIEILKERSENKLIIVVSHESINGVFDEIIDI
jgi:DNA repair exonuclease SbcCD ATPase subunit